MATVSRMARSMASTAPPKIPAANSRVLIVGGGPAGSTAAYFLAKAGFAVTVAERSTRPPYGQGIDITSHAVEVVKQMNLLEKIKARTTGETGFALLDDHGKELALLGTTAIEATTEARKPSSPTNEIEIMRGTLTSLIVDAAKDLKVEYRYGCTVEQIHQQESSISAVLSDTKQPEEFSAIIGADGVFSHVRRLGFPEEIQKDCIKPLDSYTAYFSMAVDPAERTSYSRCQHGSQGRIVWLRPIDKDGSNVSGYFITMTSDNVDFQVASAMGATEAQQKAANEKLYSGMSGIAGSAIRGMKECKDWHFTKIVQVKLPTWHVGRLGLIGDAAYCPSPLTGQGACMALLGAYVMAGELAANPSDPNAAFAEYKRKFEVYVKENGSIPMGGRAPGIFNPQSPWLVWFLRQAVSIYSKGYGTGFFSNLFAATSGHEGKFKMPIYDF